MSLLISGKQFPTGICGKSELYLGQISALTARGSCDGASNWSRIFPFLSMSGSFLCLQQLVMYGGKG